jgi:hypothetical protein
MSTRPKQKAGGGGAVVGVRGARWNDPRME